jgi:hypothetical protein
VTTLQDVINETQRLLQPDQRERIVILASPSASGATSLVFNSISDSVGTGIVRPGQQIAMDLELFYVTGVDNTTNTVSVLPGWRGSTKASHAAGAIAYIEPKFSNFDIAQQINHDLAALSAPGNGLYQMKTVDITFNPIMRGYDMAGVHPGIIDVYDIEYKQATATHYWPRMDRWKLVRNMTDSAFPSSMALMIYEGAWPGLPLHISYKAPFNDLLYLTDDLVSVAGLPSTATDLPPLGAALRLVPGREVSRNFADVQNDARRAVEVPAAAVMNSILGLEKTRQMRIDEEAGRLQRMYPSIRPGRR